MAKIVDMSDQHIKSAFRAKKRNRKRSFNVAL